MCIRDSLRFYQRQGFRLYQIVRDAFIPSKGYAEGVMIDGIPLRDQVWLELNLRESTVKVHVRNIMKKVKATNRTEVVFKLNDLCQTSISA